jgi:predicted metal-dependent enzyme (double-stranded beta helix superfamily)
VTQQLSADVIDDGFLGPAALGDLARALAESPERWADLVRHRPEQRCYERLWRDDRVDVWLICWMDDHDTGFHDHDVSAGAVAVVQGALLEERIALGGPPRARMIRGGETIAFDAAHVHRMRHAGGEPAVSIHVYSPPLARMGVYSVEADGTLRRETVPHDEELRAEGARALAVT